MPRLHVRDVAQSLQCGERRGGHRGRLRHGQPAGLAHELVRRHARLLRQRPGSAPAEHLITRFEVRDRRANGFHHTGDVPARDRAPGPAKSERQPHDVRHAGQHEVVAGVDRSGADADQDVAVPHDRPAHIGVLEHLGRPVAALHDGLHRRLGRQGVADQGLVTVTGCSHQGSPAR